MSTNTPSNFPTKRTQLVIKKEANDTIKNGDKGAPRDIAYSRARRKVISKQLKNAHATPENELFSRKDINLSAYELFCEFSTKYIKKHEAERIKGSHSSVRLSKS